MGKMDNRYEERQAGRRAELQEIDGQISGVEADLRRRAEEFGEDVDIYNEAADGDFTGLAGLLGLPVIIADGLIREVKAMPVRAEREELVARKRAVMNGMLLDGVTHYGWEGAKAAAGGLGRLAGNGVRGAYRLTDATVGAGVEALDKQYGFSDKVAAKIPCWGV
jgi:hypothetical protein